MSRNDIGAGDSSTSPTHQNARLTIDARPTHQETPGRVSISLLLMQRSRLTRDPRLQQAQETCLASEVVT